MKSSFWTIFPPEASRTSATSRVFERFHYFFDSITNKHLLAELVDESDVVFILLLPSACG